MAKQTAAPSGNDDETGKKRRGSSLLGSALLGLIALSMLGFGVTSFGGGVSRIGTVGDQTITVDQYVTALQSEVNRFSQMVGTQVPLRDLLAAGVGTQVIGQLVRRAALDGEMGAIGLSVGDTEVAAELVKIGAFQGIDGQFDRAAYGDALRRSNLTEAAFESNLRADIARGLLQSAVSGAPIAPASLVDTLLAHAGELRDISFIALDASDLPTPLPAPSEAQLQSEYQANIADYTRPEAKRIQYVALLPEDVAKNLPADEAAIAQLYQDRLDQYVIPEKRLVERLVYPDMDAALAAKAQFDAGTPFETLVATRNLTLADVDLGDVAKSDLGAAGETIFGLTEAGVVGPLGTDLGPALFRMNAILPAQETTLQQARADLALEVALDQARRTIAQRIDAIDDALAGGATLDDLAQSENLTLASTDYAKGADDNDPIAGYGAFVTAADALTMDDFPEAILLEDGGVVAMALQETLPPTPRPLAEVKDRVTENWRSAALATALEALAQTKLSALQGGADMASLGTVKTAQTARDGAVSGAPAALISAAFAAPNAGESALVNEAGFVAVMRLDKITPVGENPAAADLRAALETQLGQSVASDVLDAFGRSIETAAGISIDQNVITSVHSQLGN